MAIIIGKSKKELRALHWNEIKTRVTTHEGELLSGKKGKEYQQKWSKKYIGRDLTNHQPITADRIEYYERNKK